MINIIDKQSLMYLNEFNLKWDRKFLYGYDGEKDGFYKWLDTKLKEFESSNKQGSISLKNSGKVPEGARYPALLRKQERDNLLQDSPLRIPSGATFTITLSEPWDKARKDWYSFCETNES